MSATARLSFFPTAEPIDALRDQLGAVALSKGAIPFIFDRLLPGKLIREFVLVRVAAIAGG